MHHPTGILMGLFDWLTGGKKNFTKFEDAYALNRPALWALLKPAVEMALSEGKGVWLIVHFTETFEQLQSQLEQWRLSYTVATRELSPDFSGDQPHEKSLLDPSTINLVLADLLPDTTLASVVEAPPNFRFAAMVIDRHPRITQNDRVIRFFENIPFNVELGYFLSLDDALVKKTVSDSTIQVLRQLGLDEQELISSNLLTRRMDKVLRKLQPEFTGDLPADSAQEWLDQNS